MLKEAEDDYRRMQKAGNAEVFVELTGSPDDDEFEQKPPTCKVTIIAKDLITGEMVHTSAPKEISKNTRGCEMGSLLDLIPEERASRGWARIYYVV